MFPITREAPISGTCEKKSLLIESTLNNLTIPAFFLCEDENGNSEVIDGQQRLTTIREYAEDKFKISDSDDIEYLLPEAVQYRGKKIVNYLIICKKYSTNILYLLFFSQQACH